MSLDPFQRCTSNKLLIGKGKNEAVENFSPKKTSFLCGLAETFVESFPKFVRGAALFGKV
jgi:hypothetical protein